MGGAQCGPSGVCGSAHQQHCYGRVPIPLHIQYTYSSISVMCRFGSNNLMASRDCEGDGFVGFGRGLDIAGCRVDKGVVKGVAGEIVQHGVAPELCVCVCIIRVGHFHPTEGMLGRWYAHASK